MRKLPIPVAVVAACLGALPAAASPGPATADDTSIPVHRSPFAVVELFTSEGCSSCPPAEVLLNRIDRNARDDNTRVFTLAFHVDYWNRLGWTDPFSDAAYSDRQRDYARALRQRSVYTPQMIVNGTDGFVGSSAPKARRAIGQALDTKPALGIGFVAQPIGDNRRLSIDWRLDALPDNATLNLAITENALSTDVPRGENRGRTLEHDGVVRALLTQTVHDQSGAWSTTVPSAVDLEQASAVLFVQDQTTRDILAVHRVDLHPSAGQ
ncbi:MAG: DUF1223 domain-containing protein [Planctomycetota bacterium]